MMRDVRDEDLAAWPRTPNVIRSQLGEYYGMISHLDEQIGRVLDALRDSGLAEETLVVFAADNGLALGSHGLLGKQNLYEHSIRVPLIMAGAGLPAGLEVDSLTQMCDLYPTLCEWARVEPPDRLDGRSLRPLWSGSRGAWRDSLGSAFVHLQRAIRDDRWKLIAYPPIAHWELFDLQADPHETRNLIDDPAAQDHFARLRERLVQWQAEMRDPLLLPVERRAPKAIDLTGQPRQPDAWQPAWIVEKYFR
jgi:arylsulfatase A-like enzyme